MRGRLRAAIDRQLGWEAGTPNMQPEGEASLCTLNMVISFWINEDPVEPQNQQRQDRDVEKLRNRKPE